MRSNGGVEQRGESTSGERGERHDENYENGDKKRRYGAKCGGSTEIGAETNLLVSDSVQILRRQCCQMLR